MKRKGALPMARINTRIRPEQHAFIKATAKKQNSTEGELFRLIVDYYIAKKK